jgi:hypothetical protein
MATMDMDRYALLSWDERRAVDQWVDVYVVKEECFRFDLAEDSGGIAARFHLYDFAKVDRRRTDVPTYTVDVFGVVPCPVPIS